MRLAGALGIEGLGAVINLAGSSVNIFADILMNSRYHFLQLQTINRMSNELFRMG